MIEINMYFAIMALFDIAVFGFGLGLLIGHKFGYIDGRQSHGD